MAQGSFAAQVSGWVGETKDRRQWVHKESTQRIISIMQTPRGAGGNLRVRDGFLRASLYATTSLAMPPVTFKPAEGVPYSYDAGQVSLVIAGADISDPITAVYTANYARPREYGSRGQAGDRWVALASQQWVPTVNEVCAEAQSRAGG